jgi:hypothetical protein
MSFQSQAGIDAEINAQLPSNDAGTITAAALRQVLHDMNAVAFQVASSQGLTYSVFQYGAAGDGSTNDAAAFNAALAANAYVVAPPASYLAGTPQIVVPAGATLETFPGASLYYAGPGLALSPGGAFITKAYGDQKEQWLWARSIAGTRSTTQDALGIGGRTSSFNFGFVNVADNGQTAGIVNNLVSLQEFGSSSATGARQALLGYVYQTGITSNSNTFRDYVGGAFIGETNTGDGGTLGAELGAYFGGNSQSRLNAGAAHVFNASAHEFDVFNAAGCSVKYNWGINICSFNAVQGSSNDAAIAIYSGNSNISNGNTYGPGAGFHFGLCFAEVADIGRAPVDAGATLIGTHLETLTTFSAATGIDLTKFVFSGNAFQSNNFAISQAGAIYLGGNKALYNSSGYVIADDFAGNSALLIGSSGNSDPTNYYRNTNHYFQNIGGATNYMEVAAGGISFGVPLVSPSINGDTSITVSALGGNGGAPNASGDGLVIQNLLAASASVQQYSPNLHFIGQGWASTPGASQQVDWLITNAPAAGTSHPTSAFNFSSQINGGGYVVELSLQSNGSATFGSGSGNSIVVASGAYGNNLGGQFTVQVGGYGIGGFGNICALLGGSATNVMALSGYYGLGLYTDNVAALTFDTSQNATFSAGIVAGSATGGALGAGKINVASGIYLNNTAFTNPDYVFEKHFTGAIEKFAKPQPGGSAWGNRRRKSYPGLMPLHDLQKHVEANLRLPGIDDDPADIFERADIALEKLEEQTLYIFELHDRVARLEQHRTGDDA